MIGLRGHDKCGWIRNVDLIGNNTNIKDCNFAEGEREREKEKYTLPLQYFLYMKYDEHPHISTQVKIRTPMYDTIR